MQHKKSCDSLNQSGLTARAYCETGADLERSIEKIEYANALKQLARHPVVRNFASDDMDMKIFEQNIDSSGSEISQGPTSTNKEMFDKMRINETNLTASSKQSYHESRRMMNRIVAYG